MVYWKKVASGFGVVVLILGIVSMASYLSITKLIETASQVTHTYKVLEELVGVLSN